jgi:hypothetical protein
MSNKSAEELAAEASERGTFSFIDRLRGRNYAKDDVVVYLNEDLGYKLYNLEEDLRVAAADRVPEIEEKIKALREELAPEAYTFHMHGISNKKYDQLIDEAVEQFPEEFEEIVNPFTGEKSKQTIPSEDRNKLFTTKFWAACLDSIEFADGSVADDDKEAIVSAFKEEAPLAAIGRVSATINKLRLATDWIEYTEDEDFLAKP